MTTELDLQRGPYRTTFTGLEIQRESTPQDWEAFGEVLRRVDEAKQWAIGDWLVDGKKHYGDGLLSIIAYPFRWGITSDKRK